MTTRQEIREEIKTRVWQAIDADKTGPYKEKVLRHIRNSEIDAILSKVDAYVAEIIGEDEHNLKVVEAYTADDQAFRNELRAEQRKRAGLTKEKP